MRYLVAAVWIVALQSAKKEEESENFLQVIRFHPVCGVYKFTVCVLLNPSIDMINEIYYIE